ncbi:MAG: flagellar assembly protein FliH [Gammaproteobacteria bacterium]|nr:flagellar assembly protein FliH [Gammaproteobacteria bacterium]
MSRVIPSEELSDYKEGEAPWVHVSEIAANGSGKITANQLELLQKQAYDEGFALGHREGLAAGKAELHANAQRLNQLMVKLNTPFIDLDQQVEQELLLLVMTMVKQMVRREIKADPGQVVAVVREAMASLPVVARNARLNVHPEDAALLRDVLAMGEESASWRIVEDPVLTRGGCRVVTDTSYIDASVETRLATLIANLMGGGREHDTASR